MAWAVWLAIPVAVTILAALWTWVRSRPPRQPSTARAMREHGDYLDALATAARHVAQDRSQHATQPGRRSPEA